MFEHLSADDAKGGIIDYCSLFRFFGSEAELVKVGLIISHPLKPSPGSVTLHTLAVFYSVKPSFSIGPSIVPLGPAIK